MLKLYILTAWRNLLKNRVISLINILGLAIGLSCAVLAIVYSYHELSYEKYHKNHERISQVYTLGKFGEIEKIPRTWAPAGIVLEDQYPEVERTARTRKVNGIVLQDDQPFLEDRILVADTSVFSIMTINFVEGKVSEGPAELMISRGIAKKYFEHAEAVGKTLTIKIWGQKMEFLVTGIYRDLPSTTHLEADFIIPFSLSDKLDWKPDQYHDTSYSIYVLTRPNTDLKELNSKIVSTYEIPVDIADISIALIPIRRIHLHENIEQNSMTNLIMLLTAGIIALLVSSFNYININTILFSTRLREVGIKKTFGAGRISIFNQFMFDTFLAAFIGFVLALGILNLIMPSFNALFGTGINMNLKPAVIGLVAGLFVLTVLLSGIYPALALSKKQDLSLIRNQGEQRYGKKRLMGVLIVMQFFIAIMLLQFFILNQKQNIYMTNTNVVGFDGNDVICVSGWEWGDLKTVKHEIQNHPGIEKVSWGDHMPQVGLNLNNNWKEESNQEMALMTWFERDFLDVFKIRMKEGRFFSEEFESGDSTNVIINDLTAHSLGFDDPVGRQMQVYDDMRTIIGVVDEYQAVPPIFNDMPLIIQMAGERTNYLVARINPGMRKEAHAHIEKVLHKVNPEYPADIVYYQDYVADQVKTYYATSIMLNVFTAVIILNAMMGLFGMSFFIAERRIKEVGIRKVMGASIPEILWKLSKRFMLLLLIAFLLATPLIFLGGSQYLQVFSRHIDLTPDIFLMGGLMAFLMLVIAAGWKLYTAAVSNPAELLRHE
jgi:ABC-type antimicrobial peptide transport system permease subunit